MRAYKKVCTTDQITRLAKEIEALFSIMKDCIWKGHTEPVVTENRVGIQFKHMPLP